MAREKMIFGVPPFPALKRKCKNKKESKTKSITHLLVLSKSFNLI